MFFSPNKELHGVDAICHYLKCSNIADVLDWKLHYGLPIALCYGTWVGNTRDLREWRRSHPDLKEMVFNRPLQRRKEPAAKLPRWGN